MRVVRCIMVTTLQLTMFGPWKRVESMAHHSGFSFDTSPTAPNNGSLWIMTSGLTASYCGPGSYYYQGFGVG